MNNFSLWRYAKSLVYDEGGFIIAGVVAAVIGSAVAAYGAISSAQQQAQAAKFNQKVAKNAAIAQRQAAQIEEDNKRQEYAAILASQRSAIGGSGVMASEGSPLLVQIDSAEKAALNLSRIRYSGEVGAQAQESEAVIQGYYGKKALSRGYQQAGASLLRGAGTAAGGYGRGTSRAPTAGNDWI